jgi:alcohol dehydrogenase (NADP+)
MENLVHKGKAKAIGISNFCQSGIERILKEGSIPNADHQIELHPYLQQPEVVAFHKTNDIHITQYCPLGPKKRRGHSSPLDDPSILRISQKYSKTPAQVLGWGVAHGRTVIPKSSSPGRIEENLQSAFELDPEDLEELDGLDKNIRLCDMSEEWNSQLFQSLQ